jgi:hypothetical protein
MSYLKKTSAILIAAIALSGCAGKRGKMKQVNSGFNKQPNIAEIIKPEAKPILALNKLKAKVASNHLPRNSYLLDEHKSLVIPISDRGYTRFSIEDERISDVFIYPQESVQVRINQDYLIVVPKGGGDTGNVEAEAKTNKETTYVTITGEHGTTQDFSLRLIGKPPEPVRFAKNDLDLLNTIQGD